MQMIDMQSNLSNTYALLSTAVMRHGKSLGESPGADEFQARAVRPSTGIPPDLRSTDPRVRRCNTSHRLVMSISNEAGSSVLHELEESGRLPHGRAAKGTK